MSETLRQYILTDATGKKFPVDAVSIYHAKSMALVLGAKKPFKQ
jgi:hypothetical protein